MSKELDDARRKVAAIDKRIDAVLAELHRVRGFDPETFDMDSEADRTVLCTAYHYGWLHNPALRGFESALLSRRYDAQQIVYRIEAREARAAERRELRRLRDAHEASRHTCPTCGHEHYAVAA